MNKLLLLIASTALLVAAGLFNANQINENVIPSHVHHLFEQWKVTHGKTYATPSEHTYRLKVFAQNYLRIYAQSLVAVNYTVGLNMFSDLTKEEFLIKYTGVKFSNSQRTHEPTPRLTQQPAPPASVDWVAAGKVSAIKNQGNCGSCWAFSVISSIETTIAIQKGTLYNLSEQQLVDCATPFGP